MRCNCASIHDTIAGIPTALRTRTIQQHFDSPFDAERHFFETVASARQLVQRENCKCRRHDTGDCIREPRPAELFRVESDVAISGADLPFSEPIPFPADAAHKPVKTLQPGRYCWYQIKERNYGQRSDPATLLIVSGEYWPTTIRVLGAEQKVLSTFDVPYRRRAEGERGGARRFNCWLRRRCNSSPASTWELAKNEFR